MATIPRGDIKPIQGTRRERSVYYRPITQVDGTVVWAKTELLPSDAIGKEQYLSKGFTLSPPEDMGVSVIVDNLHPCPHCAFLSKSNFGLKAHVRIKHKDIVK